ncbi:Mobile element transfer [Streptomyces sp. NBC_00006]|uniref:mobile element transfer protein n=1 Tax=unclassified Streptomyces TaxID=2593676 RepID=UPI0022500BDA|nr:MULTISPECIES: mobile element transfer protein [unclassified Streptomyces]MCX4828264.1 Mobile element transfer [Streptomyces sp. NBC_01016]MCX5532383.1 Mobile element transfer [Streptomyces sp. NBC_00006]
MGHRFFLFQRVQSYGPVEIARAVRDDGDKGYSTVCTADGCGWSSDYSSYGSACVAAKGHHCRIKNR